jgi:hypothetical protein
MISSVSIMWAHQSSQGAIVWPGRLTPQSAQVRISSQTLAAAVRLSVTLVLVDASWAGDWLSSTSVSVAPT